MDHKTSPDFTWLFIILGELGLYLKLLLSHRYMRVIRLGSLLEAVERPQDFDILSGTTYSTLK